MFQVHMVTHFLGKWRVYFLNKKWTLRFLQKRSNHVNTYFLEICHYLLNGVETDLCSLKDNEDCLWDH